MTSLEPLFDTLSRLSIDTLLRGAILILVGYMLIRLILKLVRRALNRTNLDAHISHTLITACRLVLYFILLTMVMGQLGISSTSLVTLLGVFGLALSLALQDTLSNIAGGLFVLYTKPFKVGDYVELWGVEGTVQLIGFIHTTLTTIDNKLVYVPNGQLIEQVVSADPRIDKTAPVFVKVWELGDNAVILRIRAWVPGGDMIPARCDLYEAIKDALQKNGFHIPYPQRQLHFPEKAL